MKGLISDAEIKEMLRSVRYVEIGFREPVWVRTNSFWGGPSRSRVDKILLVLSDSPDHRLSKGMVLMTNTRNVFRGTNHWHGYGADNNIFLYAITGQSKAFWRWIQIRSNRTIPGSLQN